MRNPVRFTTLQAEVNPEVQLARGLLTGSTKVAKGRDRLEVLVRASQKRPAGRARGRDRGLLRCSEVAISLWHVVGD